MGKRFDLLVFDWDGTLHDSIGAIIFAMRAACRDLGLPEPADAQARQVIGLGLADALRHAAPTLDPRRYPEMADCYRRHYLAGDGELCLFDGVMPLLKDLYTRGFTLAVATGKSRRGLDRALAASGAERFFAASRCADECFSKPHPQMLYELMEAFDVPPGRTLMIGDTTHDLHMAANAGVESLAVSYGAHSSAQLREIRSLTQVSSVAELSDWLLANA